MTRYGDEMIQDLAKFLKVGELTKTAAKKEEKKEEKEEPKKCKECGKEKCECEKLAKKEEKEEAKAEKEEAKKEKEEKKEKKSKKAELMYGIVNDLVKLANELDESGDVEASNLVDDALKVIMKTLNK